MRVYALWFDVLSGDDKSAWKPGLFDDSRVIELWDPDGKVGRWLPKQDEYADLIFGPLAWDIYFLYGPDATWANVPSPVMTSGSTIIGKKDKLKKSVNKLFAPGR